MAWALLLGVAMAGPARAAGDDAASGGASGGGEGADGGSAEDGAEEAKGSEPSRVLVLPMERADEVPEGVSSRIAEYLNAVLGMNATPRFLSPDQLGEPEPEKATQPTRGDPVLEKAQKALWEGRERMEEEDYLEAAKSFEEAMRLYRKRLAKLEDFNLYLDAARQRALAYFRAGYGDNGEEALSEVVVMRPEIVLNERTTSDRVLGVLERLKKIYAHRPSGALTVESDPEGATVYVDGRRVGETPQTAKELTAGSHVVRVVAEGRAPWAKRIELGGDERTVSATLEPASDGEDKASAARRVPKLETLAKAVDEGRYDRRFRSRAARFADAHDLDAFVMSWVRPGGEGYRVGTFVYDREANAVAALEPLGLDRDLSTLQVDTLDHEKRIVAALESFPEDRVVDGQSGFYEFEVAAADDEEGAAAAGAAASGGAAAGGASGAGEAAAGGEGSGSASAQASDGGEQPAATASEEPDEAEPEASTDEDEAGAASSEEPEASTDEDEAGADDAAAPDESDESEQPDSVMRTARADEPDDDVSGAAAAGTAADVHRDEERERVWYRKWWVWTLAGAALAGGGVALGVGLADDGGEGFSATVSFEGGSP